MPSSLLIKDRARFAAENILTKSIRAIHPSSNSNSTTTQTTHQLQATKKWPTPRGKHGVVVVHDAQPNALAQYLLNGYKDFFESTQQGKDFNGTLTEFNGQDFLSSDNNNGIADLVCPGGAVILIQNHAFQNQTNTYRLRLPLMEMGLRVVEHPHLVYVTTPPHLASSKSSSTLFLK